MKTNMRIAALAAAALAVALAGCSASPESEGSELDPIIVGALTSLSGPNAPFGKAWIPGFEIGISYATEGTNTINGHPIEIRQVDDQSDPVATTAGATDLVTAGVNIIAGSMSSGVALALAEFADENDILFVNGSAGSDDITGINDNTFRGGRQGYQDVAAVKAALGGDVKGANICLLAHDIVYGQTNVEATKKILGSEAASFVEIYAPYPTADVAPYVQRIRDSNCDVMVPWWSGDSGPLWQSLEQQDIFADTIVVAPIQNRSSWSAYSAVQSPNVRLYASYIEGAGTNEAAEYLQSELDKRGELIEYIHEDGFNAGLMIAHAIEQATQGDGSVDEMITALEGFAFTGPSGEMTVRASDHALIRPMFRFHFEGNTPVVDEMLPADELEPPEQ